MDSLLHFARLQLHMMRARDCKNAVLQYHHKTDSLRPWNWSVSLSAFILTSTHFNISQGRPPFTRVCSPATCAVTACLMICWARAAYVP